MADKDLGRIINEMKEELLQATKELDAQAKAASKTTGDNVGKALAEGVRQGVSKQIKVTPNITLNQEELRQRIQQQIAETFTKSNYKIKANIPIDTNSIGTQLKGLKISPSFTGSIDEAEAKLKSLLTTKEKLLSSLNSLSIGDGSKGIPALTEITTMSTNVGKDVTDAAKVVAKIQQALSELSQVNASISNIAKVGSRGLDNRYTDGSGVSTLYGKSFENDVAKAKTNIEGLSKSVTSMYKKSSSSGTTSNRIIDESQSAEIIQTNNEIILLISNLKKLQSQFSATGTSSKLNTEAIHSTVSGLSSQLNIASGQKGTIDINGNVDTIRDYVQELKQLKVTEEWFQNAKQTTLGAIDKSTPEQVSKLKSAFEELKQVESFLKGDTTEITKYLDLDENNIERANRLLKNTVQTVEQIKSNIQVTTDKAKTLTDVNANKTETTSTTSKSTYTTDNNRFVAMKNLKNAVSSGDVDTIKLAEEALKQTGITVEWVDAKLKSFNNSPAFESFKTQADIAKEALASFKQEVESSSSVSNENVISTEKETSQVEVLTKAVQKETENVEKNTVAKKENKTVNNTTTKEEVASTPVIESTVSSGKNTENSTNLVGNTIQNNQNTSDNVVQVAEKVDEADNKIVTSQKKVIATLAQSKKAWATLIETIKSENEIAQAKSEATTVNTIGNNALNSASKETSSIGKSDYLLPSITEDEKNIGIYLAKNVTYGKQWISTLNEISQAQKKASSSTQDLSNKLDKQQGFKGYLTTLEGESSAQEELTKYAKSINGSKIEPGSMTYSTSTTKAGNSYGTLAYKIQEASEAYKQLKIQADLSTGAVMQGSEKTTVAKTAFEYFSSSLKSHATALTTYMLTFNSFYVAWDVFKKGISTVMDFNQAMTTISLTMNVTKTQIASLTQESINMAKEFGTTADQVTEAAKIYANMGTTVSKVMESVKPTVMLSAASGLDISTISDDIHAVMNEFNLASTDAMHISDVFESTSSNIAMDFSTGITEIAEGVQTAGALVHNAGMSFETFAGIVAKTAEVTRQSGSTIGNAWKTIVSRLSKSGSMEEEVDPDTLSKAAEALHAIGIEVYDSKGNFNNLTDTLDKLSGKWDSLTDSQKADISYQVAGIRNTNQFTVAMQSYAQATQLAAKASESNGITEKNAVKYADSLTGRLNTLKATAQELANDALNQDSLGNVITFFKSLIDLLDKSVKSVGLLATAFGAYGAISTGIKTVQGKGAISTAQTASVLSNLSIGGASVLETQKKTYTNNTSLEALLTQYTSGTQSAKEFTEAHTELDTTTKGYINTTQKEVVSLDGLQASLDAEKESLISVKLATLAANVAFSLIVTGAVVGATYAITKFASANEEAFSKAEQASATYKTTKDSLTSYKDQIVKLKTALDSGNLSQEETVTTKQQLITIQKDLISTYGSEAQGIDLVNGKLETELTNLNNIKNSKAYNTEQSSKGMSGWQQVGNTVAEGAYNLLSSGRVGYNKQTDNPYKSAYDQMISFEEKSKGITFNAGSDIIKNNLSGIQQINKAVSDTMSGVTVNKDNTLTVLGSSAQDTSDKVKQLQTLLSSLSKKYLNNDVSTQYLTNITSNSQQQISDLSSNISKYNDMYSQHIDYLLSSDEKYKKQYEQIQIDKTNYDTALSKDDLQAQTSTKEKLISDMKSLLNTTSNDSEKQSIQDFLANSYTDISSEIKNWKFDVSFTANTDNLKNNITKLLSSKQGSSITYESALNYTNGNPTGETYTKDQVNTMKSIATYAKAYETSMANVVEYLKNAGALQTDDQKALKDATASSIQLTTKKYVNMSSSEIEKYKKQLDTWSQGGNVNLSNRSEIDGEVLNKAGWKGSQKGDRASIYTSTYGYNEGTKNEVAVNFTPIIEDPKTGKYIGVLSPEELEKYANDVIKGVHPDTLNLKVGATITGKGATDKADSLAEQEHQYIADYASKTKDYTGLGTSAEDWFKSAGINTADDIKKWNDIVKATDSATEAKKKFIAVKFSKDTTAPEDITTNLSKIESYSEAIETLGDAYSDVKDGEGFDFSKILNNKDFTASFGKLDSYKDFIKTISESPDDINKTQKAFDNLTTEYIKSNGVLDNVTDSTKQSTISMLEEAGVANANDLVTESLTANKQALSYQLLACNASVDDMVNGTDNESTSLLNNANMTDLARMKLLDLVTEQTIFSNSSLNTVDKIQALKNLALAYMGTATAAKFNNDVNNNLKTQQGDKTGDQVVEDTWNSLVSKYEASMSGANAKMTTPKSSKSSGGEDEWKKAFETQYNELKHEKAMELITDKQYYDKVGALNDKYFANNKKYLSEYEQYQEEVYTGMVQLYKDMLDKQLAALKENVEQGIITVAQYKSSVLSTLNTMYSSGQLSLTDYWTEAQSYYTEQIDIMNKVATAAENSLQRQIDALNKEKTAVTDAYNVKINALEAEEKALEDANKTRSEEITLEKDEYNLARDQSQRTKGVITSKGMIYEADASAIRDAEDTVANDKYQKKVDDIEASLTALKDELSNATDAIDAQITKLQDYKDQWSKVADQYSEAQDDILASQVLGTNWESDVLAMRTSTLNTFTNNYISMMQAQADAAVAAANAEVTAYEAAKAHTISSTSSVGNKGASYTASSNKATTTTTSTKSSTATTKKTTKKYATGAKKIDEDQTAITQDGGQEIIASPTRNGVLTTLTKGDTVFSANMVQNLWDWAKLNPAKVSTDSTLKTVTPTLSTNLQQLTQQISISLPNITNESGYNNLQKELNRIKLSATQYASKR